MFFKANLTEALLISTNFDVVYILQCDVVSIYNIYFLFLKCRVPSQWSVLCGLGPSSCPVKTGNNTARIHLILTGNTAIDLHWNMEFLLQNNLHETRIATNWDRCTFNMIYLTHPTFLTQPPLIPPPLISPPQTALEDQKLNPSHNKQFQLTRQEKTKNSRKNKIAT